MLQQQRRLFFNLLAPGLVLQNPKTFKQGHSQVGNIAQSGLPKCKEKGAKLSVTGSGRTGNTM